MFVVCVCVRAGNLFAKAVRESAECAKRVLRATESV